MAIPPSGTTFQDLEAIQSEVTLDTDPQVTHNEVPHRDTNRAASIFASRISTTLTFLSGRSLWRFPSVVGHMPRYMQRKFRMKTFALMFFQLLFVFAITVGVDQLHIWTALSPKLGNIPTQVIFYVIGAMNVVAILALQNFKELFPMNYLLLSLTTLLSGIFWGLTRGVTHVTIHFQILAILTLTMGGASVASGILTNLEQKIASSHLLLASLIPCWLAASLIDIFVALLVLNFDPLELCGAIGFSFLLIGILLVDVGKLLDRCHPDDFMSVIVAMNSTLMVVVSIPFFVMTFCFLHTGEAIGRTGTEPHVNAQSVVPPDVEPVS